jgi:hypothetical protein
MRIKLLLEDPSGGQLALLEKLETSEHFGVRFSPLQRKYRLLRKVDLVRLDQCAGDQRSRVEDLRVEAAREAFAPTKAGR